MRTILVGAILSATLGVLLSFTYHRGQRSLPPGHGVAVLEENWLDETRNREVPAKIYFPRTGNGPFPAIVFSPGLGGTRDSGSRLGRDWAARGYVSVHLQHKGADADWTDSASGTPPERGQNLRKFRNRTGDVSFAIDRLQRLNDENSRLKGQIDLDRIGGAGVGLGAVTMLAVVGQVFHTIKGEDKTFTDTRLKAAVLFYPDAPRRIKAFDNPPFTKVATPILRIVSTQEDGALPAKDGLDLRALFDHTSGADQYLIILNGRDQTDLSERNLPAGIGRDAPSLELVRTITTMFWDAYLKDKPAARTWLTGGTLERTLGSRGRLENKIGK